MIFNWNDYRPIKGKRAIADGSATKAKKPRDTAINADPDAGKPLWETLKEMTL